MDRRHSLEGGVLMLSVLLLKCFEANVIFAIIFVATRHTQEGTVYLSVLRGIL
jgi:hypothetical protein